MKWNLELILWKEGSTVIATHAMERNMEDSRIGKAPTTFNVC